MLPRQFKMVIKVMLDLWNWMTLEQKKNFPLFDFSEIILKWSLVKFSTLPLTTSWMIVFLGSQSWLAAGTVQVKHHSHPPISSTPVVWNCPAFSPKQSLLIPAFSIPCLTFFRQSLLDFCHGRWVYYRKLWRCTLQWRHLHNMYDQYGGFSMPMYCYVLFLFLWSTTE